MQLKGFARVFIPAGESRTVSILLKAEDLSYWDTGKHAFVAEKGKIRVMAGSSSADIRLYDVISLL